MLGLCDYPDSIAPGVIIFMVDSQQNVLNVSHFFSVILIKFCEESFLLPDLETFGFLTEAFIREFSLILYVFFGYLFF